VNKVSHTSQKRVAAMAAEATAMEAPIVIAELSIGVRDTDTSDGN